MAPRRARPREISIRDRATLFLRLHEALEQEPYAHIASISLTITVGPAGSGASVRTDIPVRTEFNSYLIGFRQLVSEGDEAHLGYLVRALPRHIDDAQLRERLDEARAKWKFANRRLSGPDGVVLDGVRVQTRKDLVDLFLYSGRFHSRLELSQAWELLSENNKQLVTYIFRNFIDDVRRVRHLIADVLSQAMAADKFRDDPIPELVSIADAPGL